MTITIEQLRQSVINDYAKLVYEDEGTQADECSLSDFITRAKTMTWDDLVNESWYVEGDDECSLESYVESFLPQDNYLEYTYTVNEDGSTTLNDD